MHTRRAGRKGLRASLKEVVQHGDRLVAPTATRRDTKSGSISARSDEPRELAFQAPDIFRERDLHDLKAPPNPPKVSRRDAGRTCFFNRSS